MIVASTLPDFTTFLDLIQADGAIVEDYEIELTIPALGSRALLLSGQQIHNELTAPRETLVAIDDVTVRRQAEMALMAAKWHSDRANLGKSRILSAASHDLRQPLQSLNLMRAILAKKIKDKEGLKLIKQLDKTSEVMLGMLNTLLEINQLEAGIVGPEEVEFPINDLLEQLRTEFTYHAQARGLRWRVVPCRLSVWSDPRLLEQMLRNLLSNAVKYTEHGKILLGCRRRGDKLRIEVWDTGIGIPEEQLHAIFAEFHQPGNPAHDRTLGFGLGLPIVRRLGYLLGAFRRCPFPPRQGFGLRGRGTAWRKAPGARERWSATQNAADEATVRPSPSDHLKGNALRPTIFVVDDEGALRDAMRQLLQEEGWSVEVYSSGEAFLEAYHSGREGCLVVDARMPGMSGLELLERLKGRERWTAGHHDYRPCRRPDGSASDESRRHGIPRKASSVR